MTQDSLKPCAHCGGKAAFKKDMDPELDDGYWHSIQCKQCGIRTKPRYCPSGDDCPLFYSELRLLWNNRAAVQGGELAEQLKSLGEEIAGTMADENAETWASVILRDAIAALSPPADQLIKATWIDCENKKATIKYYCESLADSERIGDALDADADRVSIPKGLHDELLDYFEQREDADQPPGETPTPNEEMRLLMSLKGLN